VSLIMVRGEIDPEIMVDRQIDRRQVIDWGGLHLGGDLFGLPQQQRTSVIALSVSKALLEAKQTSGHSERTNLLVLTSRPSKIESRTYLSTPEKGIACGWDRSSGRATVRGSHSLVC
jgi:hypothetical protein